MSGKTKSTKLLGLQIQDLLASCYAPNARGTIRRSEYQMFWLQVNNKREATEFLLDVLTKLVACLDKSVQQTPGIDLQSLANTIHFITLFIEFNPADPRLKKILEQWQKQEKVGDFGRKFPSAKEVIRTLTMRVEGTQDMLGHIVIGCHTLHSVEEFKKVSDPVGSATFTDGDIQSGESVFLYPYLQAAAHHPDQLANLLVTTAQKTLTLQQQLKLNPKVAESTLLALLHMIKSFISALPVTDQALLKKVSSILQQFYLWPNPFGSFARDTLVALKNEMLVPGANLLVKAVADSRTAAVKGMDDALGQPARALYYFIEEEDEMAVSLMQTMELPMLEPQMDKLFPEKVQSAGLSPMQQLSFMLNLLKSDSGLSEAEVNQFRALSASQINSLYNQMTEFITLGNGTGKPQTAKDIRAQGWFEIKSHLAQLAAAGEPAYPWPENAKPLLDGAAPVLSPLAHLGILVPTQADYKFSSRQEVEDLIRSFPGEDVDALYLSAAVPNTPINKRLENLLNSYQVTGDKPVEVRIVLAGGNDLLHSFLCAYTNLALSRPQLFQGLRVKFYIVPFARNFVASYLGRHDSWYNRHIYTPFRSPGFLLPWIRVEKDSIEESSGELFPPGRFFRGLVESYVREATGSCDMNLYICEGWLNAPAPDGSDPKNADQLIPFLQRLEIGLVPDAREYQKKKGWPADMKFEEIVKDNRFLFNPPEVKVQFKPVDLKGRPQIVIRDGVKQDFVLDEGASYTSILVSNVPRKGDRCFPPRPTDPWLELHAQPSEAARAKQKLRKNVLMGDPRQHINELTISCLRSDESILVRLDGKNFGPFHHLTVKPLRAPDGNAIKFPVQTYFPFDL